MAKSKQPPDTVITITLTNADALLKSADILIQRGELGKLMQVEYADTADLVQAIESAQTALRHLEKFPPRIPETATEQPAAQTEAAAEEPTVDLPTKGDPTPVKLSYLKIVAGETDAKAYRRAALIGARLVDAGLWDAGTPIEIHDAHATYQRIRNLDDDALAQLSLSEIVEADENVDQVQDTPQQGSLFAE